MNAHLKRVICWWWWRCYWWLEEPSDDCQLNIAWPSVSEVWVRQSSAANEWQRERKTMPQTTKCSKSILDQVTLCRIAVVNEAASLIDWIDTTGERSKWLRGTVCARSTGHDGGGDAEWEVNWDLEERVTRLDNSNSLRTTCRFITTLLSALHIWSAHTVYCWKLRSLDCRSWGYLIKRNWSFRVNVCGSRLTMNQIYIESCTWTCLHFSADNYNNLVMVEVLRTSMELPKMPWSQLAN